MQIQTPALPSDRHVDVADGFRALFIFIIGWYHIWQQSWLSPNLSVCGFTLDVYPLIRTGYMWVDCMLLLSGFLTFLPYARAMYDHAPLPDALSFYRRRAARILPAYWFCLAVVLFCDALPNGAYASAQEMGFDLLTHLTFTHTFFFSTYFSTHLNGVLWTLAIEVQFYLIFPLLARAFAKRPALTWCVMVAISFAYRWYVAECVTSNQIWVNQLIAFLDVYALGFLGAWIYVGLTRSVRPTAAMQVLSTALCAVLCWALWQLVLRQHYVSGYEELRAMQMRNRFALTALSMMLILCASWSVRALRWLLSNRVMRFLSGISFQFYVWHQYLAVWLRKWNIPYSAYELPNQVGDLAWQWQYTLLAFAVALAAAIAATYLIEKPAQKLLLRRARK